LQVRVRELSVGETLSGLAVSEAGVFGTSAHLQEMIRVLCSAVVSWNYAFPPEAGQPPEIAPIDTDTFSRMGKADLMAISRAWVRAQLVVPDPLDGPSTGGSRSLEESIPMEISSPVPQS
jgi:hypothetical protein